MSKICTKCERSLPSEAFRNRAKETDGKAKVCAECMRKRERLHYANNTDSYSIRGKRWREDNKDKKAASDRAWKQANKERVHAMERNRLHIRRAIEKSAKATDPRLMKAEQIIYGYYGTLCMYPGCTTDNPSLDHIVAYANGGAHSFDNIQVLCRYHNMSKQAKESIDYRPVEITDADIEEILAVI